MSDIINNNEIEACFCNRLNVIDRYHAVTCNCIAHVPSENVILPFCHFFIMNAQLSNNSLCLTLCMNCQHFQSCCQGSDKSFGTTVKPV